MGASSSPTPAQEARAQRLLVELVTRTGLGRGASQLRVDDVRIVKGRTTALIVVAVYHEVGSRRRHSIAIGADPGADAWDQLSDAEVTALLARDAAAFLDGHHWQRLIGVGLRAAAALGALATVAAVLLGSQTGLGLPTLGFAVLAATQLITAALGRGLDLQADRRSVVMTGNAAALAGCYRREAATGPGPTGGLGRVITAWRRLAVGRAAADQRLAHIAATADPS
ncbi:MAG TPA: hypothetical protein VGL20_06685 [Candidatus Dormibacteraeota bacterium]|jgi:hypothetical protein